MRFVPPTMADLQSPLEMAAQASLRQTRLEEHAVRIVMLYDQNSSVSASTVHVLEWVMSRDSAISYLGPRRSISYEMRLESAKSCVEVIL